MAYVDNKSLIRFNSFDSNIFTRGKKVGNEQYDHVTVDELFGIAEDY